MSTIHTTLAALAQEPRMMVLAGLVIAAAVVDARTHRIPNLLTVCGAAAGVALALADAGSGPTVAGSLLGGMCGLALLLPLYALRAMGAGDVKLMAAVGTFLGATGVLHAVLFTFIAGGIAALAWIAWHRGAGTRVLGNVRALLFAAAAGQPAFALAGSGRMPYAFAICAGTLAAMVWRLPLPA
jgi:prepilin peptidase CpaA